MSTEGGPTCRGRFAGYRHADSLVFLVAGLTAAAANAATPYDAGKMRATVALGSSVFSESRYIVAGMSFGYYLVDGLEVSATGYYWIGGTPTIFELSPGARYVLFFVPGLQPFVGAFYRHRFISQYPDQDSVGGEVGAFYPLGVGAMIGGGAVYERMVSECNNMCAAVYPELFLALSF